jgi:hypothetical protein
MSPPQATLMRHIGTARAIAKILRMMKFLLRAKGSEKNDSERIARCLSLAERLKKNTHFPKNAVIPCAYRLTLGAVL